jgi:hypothetical protein
MHNPILITASLLAVVGAFGVFRYRSRPVVKRVVLGYHGLVIAILAIGMMSIGRLSTPPISPRSGEAVMYSVAWNDAIAFSERLNVSIMVPLLIVVLSLFAIAWRSA